ncbi:DUF1559 family PulG-like putative transporter [Planctomicrobium sp. SH664]|uniref:DUF1559 family PulG-like putative transporter n=1 Tax=Planctomicrobium sp. SH664 TaxID=3448125 RepID=UPI003F5C2EE6
MNSQPESDEQSAVQQPAQKSRKSVRIWQGVGICLLLAVLLLPFTRDIRPAVERSQCKRNLFQIGLALRSYSDMWESLPPAYTVDASGNRLHSWRTLLLPHLGQEELFQTIDLSKPWYDPVNRIAWKTEVSVYQCPSAQLRDGFTNYMAAVGPDYCFLSDRGRQLSEFQDGLSNTVVVFETNAAEAVHWMSPYDTSAEFFVNFNPETQHFHTGGLQVLMGEGSPRFMSADGSAQLRQALLTVSGNEPLGEY